MERFIPRVFIINIMLKTVAYIPAAFCRDAGSAGHGATEAARPERSLQACGFYASDRSDSPKPRQRVRRRLAGAPAAACRSRA
ncbi:TPA: hypothetical protein ACHYMJ_004738 [Escherichia coli]|nr:hypothetical protein [Escherichia coli]MEC4950900.1 hypothetical protein [Escherichia coli]MEC4966498.1 hypothetical protein [Escherichia coli]MEC5007244.1 hypothetical protein [Escherichia coli]MEC5017639.1 hypothetical protein [Escherichia coli]